MTRRWYYLIPAEGEPAGLVHNIEFEMLNALPGAKARYSSWQEQIAGLQNLLSGRRRIAMQYSPQCAIPYVSMVDAGTVRTTLAENLGAINAANLRRAHAMVESGRMRGKLVLEGF